MKFVQKKRDLNIYTNNRLFSILVQKNTLKLNYQVLYNNFLSTQLLTWMAVRERYFIRNQKGNKNQMIIKWLLYARNTSYMITHCLGWTSGPQPISVDLVVCPRGNDGVYAAAETSAGIQLLPAALTINRAGRKQVSAISERFVKPRSSAFDRKWPQTHTVLSKLYESNQGRAFAIYHTKKKNTLN